MLQNVRGQQMPSPRPFEPRRGLQMSGVPLVSRNVDRLRGGLAFKAHRLFYYSTLGSRVIKKEKTSPCVTYEWDTYACLFAPALSCL